MRRSRCLHLLLIAAALALGCTESGGADADPDAADATVTTSDADTIDATDPDATTADVAPTPFDGVLEPVGLPDESGVDRLGDPVCPGDIHIHTVEVPPAVLTGRVEIRAERNGAPVTPYWATEQEIVATDWITGREWSAPVADDGTYALDLAYGEFQLSLRTHAEACGYACPDASIDLDWLRIEQWQSEADYTIDTGYLLGSITLDGAEMPSSDNFVDRGHIAFVDQTTAAVFYSNLNDARPTEVHANLPLARQTYAAFWVPEQLAHALGSALPLGAHPLGIVSPTTDTTIVDFDATSLAITLDLTLGGAPLRDDGLTDGEGRGELYFTQLADGLSSGFTVDLGESGSTLELRVAGGAWTAWFLAGPDDAQDVFDPFAVATACPAEGCAWSEAGTHPLALEWSYGASLTPDAHLVRGTASVVDASGAELLTGSCGRVEVARQGRGAAGRSSTRLDAGGFELALEPGRYDVWLHGGWSEGCPVGATKLDDLVVDGPIEGLALRAEARSVALDLRVNGATPPDDTFGEAEGRGVLSLIHADLGAVFGHDLGDTGPAGFERMVIQGTYDLLVDTTTFDTKTSRRPLEQAVLPIGAKRVGALRVRDALTATLDLPVASLWASRPDSAYILGIPELLESHGLWLVDVESRAVTTWVPVSPTEIAGLVWADAPLVAAAGEWPFALGVDLGRGYGLLEFEFFCE